MNFLAIAVSALVPMLVGFVWYNPKVFGTIWMNATGMTEEKAKGANMIMVFGLSLVFSFILAFAMQGQVIHQFGVFSSLYYALEDPQRMDEAKAILSKFEGEGIYANDGRTFKHGALHGVLFTLFLVLPIFATNALFERKSLKYILVNIGYWTLSLTIVGGILSVWK